jgi:hypothetical protein
MGTLFRRGEVTNHYMGWHQIINGGEKDPLPKIGMTQTHFGRQEYIFCNSDEKILLLHRFPRIDFFLAIISSIVELISCERGREDPRTKLIPALKNNILWDMAYLIPYLVPTQFQESIMTRPKIPAHIIRQKFFEPIIEYVHFIEAKNHKNHVGFYELFILWSY